MIDIGTIKYAIDLDAAMNKEAQNWTQNEEWRERFSAFSNAYLEGLHKSGLAHGIAYAIFREIHRRARRLT